MSGRSVVIGVALLLAVAGVGAVGTVTAGAAEPSLSASIAFGRSAYVSGQAVSATLTVQNTGSSDARGLHASADDETNGVAINGSGFGNGFSVPAGKTVTISVSGHPADVTATTVRLSGYVYASDGTGIAQFGTTAPVDVRHETITGEVFGDADANGRPGAHEGLDGATVRFGYAYGDRSYVAKTGRTGHFSVVVPSASYYVDGGTSRWKILPHFRSIGAHATSLALRAVRPLGKVLKASVRFTKSRYTPGQKAHIVVSMTDTGSAPLRGIAPSCDRAGNPNELVNVGRAWGRLTEQGPGVVLKPHRTSVFHVTATVPKAAQQLGSVDLACDFGYPGVDEGYRPEAQDSARVPGQSGTLTGVVDYYAHGHSQPATGVRNVRVVLVDPTTCPVYKRTATTDAHGTFTITHAPAGENYRIYLFPPKGFKAVGGNPTNASVVGRDTNDFGFEVAKGSGHRPTVPTRCS